jgi:zinc transport system substrate-binding protein
VVFYLSGKRTRNQKKEVPSVLDSVHKMSGSKNLIKLIVFLLIGVGGWTVLWGASAGEPTDAKVTVSASILPLGDFCQNLGGDRVAVQVLIPPGASPHIFEPSPASVTRVLDSRVLVYVGAGLDPWMERLVRLHNVEGLLAVEAVQGLPLITEAASGPADREENKEPAGIATHSHQEGNPHVWLDPVLAQNICRRITQAFIQADPEHRMYYESRLSAYLDKLEKLHQDITEKVATFRRRDYVTFHPSFAYFARRYGLREVGVIQVAPGREPSPGHLQKIITAVKNTGVKAVFAEPQLSPRVAQIIAREAGVKVLFLDPLGGRPPYGGDYLKLMRHNLNVFAQVLQ